MLIIAMITINFDNSIKCLMTENVKAVKDNEKNIPKKILSVRLTAELLLSEKSFCPIASKLQRNGKKRKVKQNPGRKKINIMPIIPIDIVKTGKHKLNITKIATIMLTDSAVVFFENCHFNIFITTEYISKHGLLSV